MATDQATYDLTVLLDTAVDEEARLQILQNVAALIDADGEIVGRGDWGVRQMAYEIRHKGDADYHLLQFRSGPELIERLSRTLRITDGILRHRIIRLPRGTEPLGFAEPAADVA